MSQTRPHGSCCGIPSAAPPELNTDPWLSGWPSGHPARQLESRRSRNEFSASAPASRLGLRQPSAAFSRPRADPKPNAHPYPAAGQSGSFAPLRSRTPRRCRVHRSTGSSAAEFPHSTSRIGRVRGRRQSLSLRTPAPGNELARAAPLNIPRRQRTPIVVSRLFRHSLGSEISTRNPAMVFLHVVIGRCRSARLARNDASGHAQPPIHITIRIE
jgi:hypothetical protein